MFGLAKALARYVASFKMDILDTGAEAGGSITFSFINSSHLDIVVLDRNNENLFVEKALPGTDVSEPGLTIKMTRYHSSRASTNAIGNLTNSLASQHGGFNVIQQNTLDIVSRGMIERCGASTVCRRFFVPIKDIENHRSVFETRTGLVLCVNGGWSDVCHPESEEFRAKNQNAGFLDKQPVGRLFEIVDNHHQHKERFVFVGNEVLRVHYTADVERDNGLWVTEVESKGGARSVSRTTRYDFEEGYKKFGLFLTREEAETSGNPGILQQKEIEDLKRQIAVDNHKMAIIEQARAAEVAERKSMLEKSSHELKESQAAITLQETMANSETQRWINEQRRITEIMKDDAERERIRRDVAHSSYSSSLKSSTDTFKYVPAIVTGVLAAGAGLLYFLKG